jgi:hypothetical protein
MTIVSIIGSFFYKRIFKPQNRLDKKQAVDNTVASDKAHLLAEQFQWKKEEDNRRFTELALATAKTNETALNHIHTIGTKVDSIAAQITQMNLNLTKELAITQTDVKGIKDYLEKCK